MKKIYLFLAVTIMFLIVTASVLPTASTNQIPDDLKVVFKNSCMACHATGGSMMAMAKVNFSNWESYDTDKQAKKADAICKMVSKGAMPPKSFIKSNPGAVLTELQKNNICKWSEALNQNK